MKNNAINNKINCSCELKRGETYRRCCTFDGVVHRGIPFLVKRIDSDNIYGYSNFGKVIYQLAACGIPHSTQPVDDGVWLELVS